MITIVGAGALGSHMTLLLRNVDSPMQIVDFDKVEQKNVQAQFHTKMTLGRNKALSLQKSMQGMFGLKLKAVPNMLRAGNISEIFRDTHLILDCTDNIKTRLLIKEFADHHNMHCLHACLAADGAFARIIWSEDFVPDAESEEGEATCEGGEHLPFYGMVASLAAGVVQMFLKNGKKMGFQLSPTSIMRLT